LNNVSQFLEKYDTSNIDVIMLYQARENYQNKLDDFTTLHFDLEQSEDEIFKNIRSKNTRNEIRKNIKDDNVNYSFKENLSDNDIESLMHDLDWFMKEKNKDTNISFAESQTRGFVENICVTYVKKDGVTLASHLYMFDENRVRYTLGISYRHKGIDPKIVGRSNRGLHWFDMKLFREKNLKIYDFGGIAIDTDNKDEKNIRRFKESFTKNSVSEYQGNVGVSLKGKLALFMHKLRKKFTR
jgi:lipid II:glycine glycyltransferase (peptidoglycan interpeptide bridge formation enzyme)